MTLRLAGWWEQTYVPPSDFGHQRFELRRFRPVRLIWGRRLVRGVANLVVGEEGVGKGTIEARMIAGLTRGEGEFGGEPLRVLWLGDEDDSHEIVGPRLHAAGVDFDYVEEVVSSGDALLNVTTQAEALDGLLKSGPFAALVFEALLDNLPPLRRPYDPQEIRASLRPPRGVLRRREVIGIASLHTRKGDAKEFREKVAGSHQFNALSRSSLLVAHHPDGSGRRALLAGKANYAHLATPLSFAIEPRAFELNGVGFEEPIATGLREEPDLTMEEVLSGPLGKRDREQAERRELVLSKLTDKPQSVRSVATAARLSPSTTGRYLADLVDEGLAVQGANGFVLAKEEEG